MKILVQGKTVRADHFWSSKIGPGGPYLVVKIDPVYNTDRIYATKCCKWCETTL